MLSTTKKFPSLTYRPDIDGLRAIAVLSVVGFHAFPYYIPSGFIGVDIFFVISGFLISSIIFSKLDHNNFSIVDFYARRIRRIFPALLTVMLTCFIAGWFFLLAEEYKQLGKHIAGGSGFISNFLLWEESGYFDNIAETKPMLHLWSLAIEEQFYIGWPLLLIFLWQRQVHYLCIIIAIISFATNIYFVNYNPIIAFYFPISRFWEMMIGGLLAWVKLYDYSWAKKYKNIQLILGIILLVFGFIFINKNQKFPGYWALLPTFGSFFLISAGPNAFFNKKVLSSKILTWVGVISYPLYLWHWPLLTFLRIIEGGYIDHKITTYAIFSSIILAWATYRFVETPIRSSKNKKLKDLIILTVLMVIVGFGGFSCYQNKGYPLRQYNVRYESYSQTIKRTDRATECFDIPFAYSTTGNWFCKIGNPQSPPVIFAYGDSHALSLIPALEMYAQENNKTILFAGSSGCPPLIGVQSMRGEADIKKNNCQKLNERIFQYVKKNNIKTVLLIGRWTYYTGGTAQEDLNFISKDPLESISKENSCRAFEYGLDKTIKSYEEIGVKVLLVEDNPYQPWAPKNVLRKSKGTDSSINQLAVSTLDHLKTQSFPLNIFNKIQTKNFIRINFDSILCNSNFCPLAIGGKFLYFDNDHLSIEGAKLVYPILNKSLLKNN